MSLGTPYEIDTKNKILFIEEVGEQPNDLDRMLTHLYNAGKLDNCKGVVFRAFHVIGFTVLVFDIATAGITNHRSNDDLRRSIRA